MNTSRLDVSSSCRCTNRGWANLRQPVSSPLRAEVSRGTSKALVTSFCVKGLGDRYVGPWPTTCLMKRSFTAATTSSPGMSQIARLKISTSMRPS